MISRWNLPPVSSWSKYGGWFVVIFAAATYMFLTMNTPLVIMVWQNYDDNLFVRLGQYFAEGRWLGPFNQFTLMKGPGYPLFLAASYWAGLPITFTEGLFYCLALSAFALVALKVTKSRLVALVLFVAPLLHPKMFETARIMRDVIYVSQSILFLALLSYCLLVAENRRSRTISAIVAGLLFGWLWLTREEGVWLLPGTAGLVTYAFLRKRAHQSMNAWLSPALIVIGVFFATQLLFAAVNYFNYGKFIGVDFKEHNFQAALSAMESVQAGTPIPYVNVPRAARMQIYTISPSFARLRPYLDPSPSPSPKKGAGCQFRPTTCGDFGNGFFMWSLRDAAAAIGEYNSPEMAAHFFERITKDIQSACDEARLRCAKWYVPYMPRMTPQQINEIPKSAGTLLSLVVHPGKYPGFNERKVTGTESDFHSTLDFLNHPVHYPLTDSPSVYVHIKGWYHNPTAGNEWFSINVSDSLDKARPYSLSRVASPDLVRTQHDQRADHQRFAFRTQCGTGCTLRFTAGNGVSRDVVISDSAALARQFMRMGSGLLVFDGGMVSRYEAHDERVTIAGKTRAALYPIYRAILPTLLGLGALAFIVGLFIAIRRRLYPIVLGMAAACWISVMVRSAILVLIDVSSFSAMITPYLLPIFSLTVIASILSLCSIWMLVLPTNQEDSTQQSEL